MTRLPLLPHLMSQIWISELLISRKTERKLIEKHGLTADDIRSALVGVPGLRFSWHYHPTRGQRAILKTRIAGQRCLVVLYPDRANRASVWRLGSAYEDN